MIVMVIVACAGESTDEGSGSGELFPACLSDPCVGEAATAMATRREPGASLGYSLVTHDNLVVASAPSPFASAVGGVFTFDSRDLGELGSWAPLFGDHPTTGLDLVVADLGDDGILDIAVSSPLFLQGDGSPGAPIDAGGRAHLLIGAPTEVGESLEETAILTVAANPLIPPQTNSSGVGHSMVLADFGSGDEWGVAVPGEDEVWFFDTTLRGIVGRSDARRILTEASASNVAAWDAGCDGTTDLVVAHAARVDLFESPLATDFRAAVASARWTTRDDENVALLGVRAVPDGDLDGDGCPDLALGAPTGDVPIYRAGAVFVVSGSNPTSQDTSELPIQVVGDTEQEAAGYGVAVGDIDGDGSDDLVVGSPSLGGGAPEGSIRLFLGPMSGTYGLDEAAAILIGERPGDLLGREIVIVDSDGDAQGDVIAAASGAYGGGALYLVPGSSWFGPP